MIGNRLKTIRLEKGISQEELADKINISRQSISNFENSVSVPNLNNLIELSKFFNITLDQLVYGTSCSFNNNISFQSDSLNDFLVISKRNTYANGTNEIETNKENTYKYEYINNDYTYTDTYYGSSRFAGCEVVYLKNVPIFSLNYSGIVLNDNFNSRFLKESLMKVNAHSPFRGPNFYSNNDYTYICNVSGDINYFHGNEEIYYKDIKVYELYFHGGTTK